MPHAAAVALLFAVNRCYGLQTTTRRLLAIVRYDGTGFHGVQKNQRTDDGTELRTVLSELEQSLWPALDQQVTFRVAGRTDAGVSALGQVVSFDLASRIEGDGDVDDEERIHVNGAAVCVSGLAGVLNSYLPSDLQIVEIATVPSSFDAVRDCKWKRYRYRLPSCPPESDGNGDEEEDGDDERGATLLKMVASHAARAARQRAAAGEAGGDGSVAVGRRRRRKRRGAAGPNPNPNPNPDPNPGPNPGPNPDSNPHPGPKPSPSPSPSPSP